MRETIIAGRRVLLPGGVLAEAVIRLGGGRILEVEAGRTARADFDAGQLLILPGIVDLHGDAFERQIHPRPGVSVGIGVALAETDRQMSANGISTAFHGLTVTWEPGTRDLNAAKSFLAGFSAIRSRLRCDTRLHLRHEVLSIDTVPTAIAWIEQGLVDLVALNDHSAMVERAVKAQHLSASRLAQLAVSEAEYRTLAEQALSRRDEVAPSLQHLAQAACSRHVPLASHDDETSADRDFYRGLGARICEFPANRETAEAAIAGGDALVLGGPNILRNGSHCGRVTAAEMIQAGLCTAICSDYFYPSVLHAPFRLAASGKLGLPEAWNLVSRGPALAAGLDDRGSIESGCRADVVLIDDSDPLHPDVQATFVAGVPIYAASPSAALA